MVNFSKDDMFAEPLIFNKSFPACPFLNIKLSKFGDAVVPAPLKYVLAPLSKQIR